MVVFLGECVFELWIFLDNLFKKKGYLGLLFSDALFCVHVLLHVYHSVPYAIMIMTCYSFFSPKNNLYNVLLPVIEELKATGKFEMMDLHVDEAEHSMEMHLPYLAKVFEG